MSKEEIITRALEHAQMLIGTNYSTKGRSRFDLFRGGSMDCSSFVASNFLYAGFPLLVGGKEVTISTDEVYAGGFDLVYPSSQSLIGRQLPSPKSLLSTYGARAGDVIFFNFNGATSRKNKITHVGMVLDAATMIHIGNDKDKCCKKSLVSYGKGHVCAIIRLREDVSMPDRPVLISGDSNRVYIRMLQVVLNMSSINPKLRCDGDFGPLTEKAVIAFKQSTGFAATGMVDAQTWAKLLPKNETEGTEEMIAYGQKDSADVKAYQQALIGAGYDLLSFGADGDFGDETLAAHNRFQTDHGVAKTRIVDIQTQCAMFGLIPQMRAKIKSAQEALE